MALKIEEITALVPDAQRLGRESADVGQALVDAFRRDADGMVRLTAKERRKLSKELREAGEALTTFGLKLIRDTLD